MLVGGAGNDSLVGGAEGDTFFGGPDADMFQIAGGALPESNGVQRINERKRWSWRVTYGRLRKGN